MPSYPEHFARIQAQVQEISAEAVNALLQNDAPPLIVDVRERDEWESGFVPTARLLGRGFLETRMGEIAPHADTPIVLYCAGGARSALAAHALQAMGYTHVQSMAGGFTRWAQHGFPVQTRQALTQRQVARYSRHLSMPEVGEAGQLRLLRAKVLLVGAGGLGSPTAMYLAAAGVGTLGIVDADTVDLSNLQRQLLHTEDRVGMAKVESAQACIAGINSDVVVHAHRLRLDTSNVMDLFKDYDVIIDGSDNFATRYLINDACFFLNKPNVHGSIFRFEGQITVFKPHVGPCYRCLYPEAPPADTVPSCEEAGVLGVLPGIIGVAQAIETLKLILDVGDPLVGRLLTFDALQMRFRELKTLKEPHCPLCGVEPTRTGLLDDAVTCAR